MNKHNKYLGQIREKRVHAYISKYLKWQIEKANYAYDKYHSIDFICRNKKNELVFVQVKGTSQVHKEFADHAIAISNKHDALLYYFYIGNSYNSKIYIRKWNGSRNQGQD